jgi:hypothetical protein
MGKAKRERRLKRVRITEYVEAPSDVSADSGAGSSALFRLAAPTAAGHPALIRFAPGAHPPAGREGQLVIGVEQDEASTAIRMSATDDDGGGGRWGGDFTAASEYMIAVVDKSSGTARIVEAAGEFCLSRSLAVAAPAPGDEHDAQDDRTYQERRGALLGEFGGKRAKDRQAKMDRNAITDARVSAKAADQLYDVIGAHQQTKASAKARSGTTSVVAPPHNVAATLVEDAYPLMGLMGTTEYSFMVSEAEASLANAASAARTAPLSNPGWHGVCWGLMLESLSVGKDAERADAGEEHTGERRRRVVAAMYLHYLIVVVKFSSTRVGGREREELKEQMAVPDDVLDCLLTRFTEQREGQKAERYKSEQSQVRLIYYAVVLWLTASGFVVTSGYDDVARALGLTPTQLLVHCKHVGCQVKRASRREAEVPTSGPFRVRLTVPLSFPDLRKVRVTPRQRR